MAADTGKTLEVPTRGVTTKEEGYPPRVEAILRKQALNTVGDTGTLRVRKLRNEVCVDNNNTLP